MSTPPSSTSLPLTATTISSTPPSNPSSTTRQFAILTELNATVHTLHSINTVLDEINSLVSPTSSDSIYMKQEGAIMALRRWEKIYEDTTTRDDDDDDDDGVVAIDSSSSSNTA
jgi:hypothetical protein